MANYQLDEINLSQLPAGTIFKIGFLCNLGIWGAFGLLVGVMALFGFETVRWGGAYVTGFGGLIVGVLISAIFSVFGAVLLFLGGLLTGWAARHFNFGTLHYLASTTKNPSTEASDS